MGIYKIYFFDPNLFYIGSAINFRIRWSLHRRQLQKGKHHNIHLQRAFTKYGSDALHFEVVEYVECKENLIEREQYYLDALNPHFNIFKNARNMLGLKHTEESKEKNRIAHLGKAPPNKGKPMSEKQKQYYRDLYTGRPTGRRPMLGRHSWNRGKSPSPESIAKGIETRRKNGTLSNGNINRSPEVKGRAQEKRRATLLNRTPEQKAETFAKRSASWQNKTPEQKAAITAKQEEVRATKRAAKPRKWSRYFDACIECGTTERRYGGNGMCKACHQRHKRKKNVTHN